MGEKQLIAFGIVMLMAIGSMLYMSFGGDTKLLQQKIIQTQQGVQTVRDWAVTFAGISTTKDYKDISMQSLKAKGLFNYDVNGSGTSSTIKLPSDDSINLALAASSNNKEFIVTVTLASDNNFDETEKQIFEDKLNADLKSSATQVTSYTSSGADGTISFQFSN
ncbi:hypothetical protein N5912_02545 [Arcobacter lacus]|uniref:hypothetical protein n=1 Tax=Arcobacter lacus TaxID=1912876 RepID=UPI0021BB1BCB|nr:hypothetical protein [Arcobacter lacus]MCT7910698.1 hypothetical protein [Arcobacter lacus]